MGLPNIADINSPNEPAVGIATIDLIINASGERHSTMRAFLPQSVAVERKAHLNICPNTLVSRLAMSHHTGKNPKVDGVFSRVSKMVKHVHLLALLRKKSYYVPVLQ